MNRLSLRLLVVATLVVGCAHSRVLVLRTPERDHPIARAVADAIRPGLTVDDVSRLAGRAAVVGAGVSAASDHPWGAATYHVHWDVSRTPDPANGAWIYLIKSHSPAPKALAEERFLFVEMSHGVVSRVYEGRIGSWGM